MANHPNRRKGYQRLYTLAYRYIPGAIGDGSTVDNGAVVTAEFETAAERDAKLAELKADKRIQWARAADDTSRSDSSYGL